jgi:RES domain-containing protein
MTRRSLIEALERLPRTKFHGRAYRQMAPRYDPMDGEGARTRGGRWNPPDSFPVLYTALERSVAIAEVHKRATREGISPQDLLPRKFVTYRIELQRVLDLTNADAVESLNLSPEMLTGADVALPQAIGDAARYVGFEAILARSAAAEGRTLSIFSHSLAPGSIVEPVDIDALESL